MLVKSRSALNPNHPTKPIKSLILTQEFSTAFSPLLSNLTFRIFREAAGKATVSPITSVHLSQLKMSEGFSLKFRFRISRRITFLVKTQNKNDTVYRRLHTHFYMFALHNCERLCSLWVVNWDLWKFDNCKYRCLRDNDENNVISFTKYRLWSFVNRCEEEVVFCSVKKWKGAYPIHLSFLENNLEFKIQSL